MSPRQPIRVLHVSPTDTSGGASLGAYGIHKALAKVGADSLMLVMRKYSNDPSVVTRGGGVRRIAEGMRDRLDRLPLKLQTKYPENWWTVGWLPLHLGGAVRRFNPDIVQFHWTGRGAAPIQTIAQLRDYPIVWTLRDMWPLTGGCHYSGGCQKFLSGCGKCPQIGSDNDDDLSSWQWRRKDRAWRDMRISFVALSRWMADYARRSPLLSSSDVTIIPNGIDTTTFRPAARVDARTRWRLPQDRRIIMFGALYSTRDPRKGFADFCEALRLLSSKRPNKDLLVVIFGADGSDQKLDVDVRYVGTVAERSALASLYACADVMVVPSREENLGKTALEAMACGIPVVAFANTGQLDIVDHKETGYLASDGSAADLAEGIDWTLNETVRSERLSSQARAKAVRCFDIGVVAQQYMALYERLLEAKTARVAGSDAAPWCNSSAGARSMITAIHPRGGRG